MKTIEDVKRIAIEDYMNGGHCVEMVFKYVGREFIEGFDEDLVRIGTPFGGGICNRGDLCGALAGGLMIIGYLTGRRKTEDNQDTCRDLAREYYDKFKQHFGTTSCADIHSMVYNRETHVKCAETVKEAIDIIWDVLKTARESNLI
jgi:C_GCAxxG_C_C family probable redox protein